MCHDIAFIVSYSVSNKIIIISYVDIIDNLLNFVFGTFKILFYVSSFINTPYS